MKFRYARHTINLNAIEKFYVEVVGLEKLGGFENHDQYDGIFLGNRNSNWHLEFTTSTEKPDHKFDEEDVLVFYVNTDIELIKIKKIIQRNNISLETPKNPYWKKNGIMISDPDGHKVIFSLQQLDFTSTDDLTKLIKNKGIENWNGLIEFIRMLPYGRNSNRSDFSLVINEGKGTCSSKHALLKKVADLNNFNNVQLILGMYRMNKFNTPKIGDTILNTGLEYIPEAHCYLKLNNHRIDVTTDHSDIENLSDDIIDEIEISSEQVSMFKIDYHKNYLEKWINENRIPLNFDKVWEIREHCIKKLEA